MGPMGAGHGPSRHELKGGDAKTRPPETLTNADFKILYSKTNSFFDNTRLFLK